MRWRTLGIIALGLMMVTGAKAEEKFDVDGATWENVAISQKPDPESRIAFISKLSPGSIVAGPATEPPNPFPDLEASLYVSAQNPADGWFRLVGRPFVEESPTQGTLEFDFHLVEGTMTLSLGYCDQQWMPEKIDTYYITESKGGVSFTPDKGITIRGRAYQTSSHYNLKAGENYRFMVKWDMSTPEQTAYFLNGEPLTPQDGGVSSNISGPPSGTGINAFRITLGGAQDHLGSFFLGRLSGSSAPVDLFSAEGLIGKESEKP